MRYSIIQNTENIPPQVIKRVLKEIAEITAESLDGVRLISNEQDIADIQAYIDGPADTPYQGGCFRIKLILCKGFPMQPPKAYFITKIFVSLNSFSYHLINPLISIIVIIKHPNVASNGEICVNTLKKDWKPELGIKHILLVINLYSKVGFLYFDLRVIFCFLFIYRQLNVF